MRVAAAGRYLSAQEGVMMQEIERYSHHGEGSSGGGLGSDGSDVEMIRHENEQMADAGIDTCNRAISGNCCEFINKVKQRSGQ